MYTGKVAKRCGAVQEKVGEVKLSDRLAEYGDKYIKYSEVAMPELLVQIFFLPTHVVHAKVIYAVLTWKRRLILLFLYFLSERQHFVVQLLFYYCR